MEKLSQVLKEFLHEMDINYRSLRKIETNTLEILTSEGFKIIVSYHENTWWIRYPDGKIQSLVAKKTSILNYKKSQIDENAIKSPALGKVVKVLVSNGDLVTADQVLIKIESMKMEIDIKARLNTTIDKILVSTGDTVKYGQTLVTFALKS